MVISQYSFAKSASVAANLQNTQNVSETENYLGVGGRTEVGIEGKDRRRISLVLLPLNEQRLFDGREGEN